MNRRVSREMCGSAMHPRSKVGRSHKLMPKSDPKDLCPPAKYKPRRGARALSAAEIKAASNVAAVALALVLGVAIRSRSAGKTTRSLHRSQHRPSLTGCALLPKPTIGPPQIEQTCTGVMAHAPLREAGREARPESACPKPKTS